MSNKFADLEGKVLTVKERDKVVDITKGIGILLVAAVHTGLGFLNGLDMPFFFLVSGFFAPVTAKQKWLEALQKKASQLLLPMFKYLIALGFLGIFLSRLPASGLRRPPNLFYWLTIDQLVVEPFLTWPRQPNALVFWFITTLFLGYLLWLLARPYLEKLRGEQGYKLSILVLSLIFLYYAAINGPELKAGQIVGCIDRVVYAFVFITSGFLLYPYKDEILYGKYRWLLFTMAVGALYWKIFYFAKLPAADVRTMSFAANYRLLSLFVTFFGIALIFSVSLLIAPINVLNKAFIWIGQKSLHVMALSDSGRWLFKWLLRYFQIRLSDFVPPVAVKWSEYFFAIGFCVLLIYLFEKFCPNIRLAARNFYYMLKP